ncbi:MAG: vanadium-dependent haloperoxidase [Verrucomicrobia bacterium]|nr:vanadium-dependent haloperoxidase [Verrucomicrobiota bacterium]
MTPFALPALEPFSSLPPPALSSSAYATALNQVQALGGKVSTLRTARDSETAVFWSDFSYTSMPPGHWHLIAEGIAVSQTNSLVDNARLFALLSLAQADTGILCWEAKFRYNLWRPVTAIQRADEDSNPLTHADPMWDHFLSSPPFPAYFSGHSSFSAASAVVLADFYGRDTLPFKASSDSLPGVARDYTSLADCADEVGMSRIYGGIHYSFDNTEGKEVGRKVGNYVSTHFLLPVSALPSVRVSQVRLGTVELTVQGRGTGRLELQVSEDLRTFVPLSSSMFVPGGWRYTDTNANFASKFYRAVETE